jgi:hypothetical protein
MPEIPFNALSTAKKKPLSRSVEAGAALTWRKTGQSGSLDIDLSTSLNIDGLRWIFCAGFSFRTGVEKLRLDVLWRSPGTSLDGSTKVNVADFLERVMTLPPFLL